KGQTLLLSTPMPRLTIALEDRDHLALRLLALRDGKRLNEVVDEAVKRYLESAGAYTLRISDSETNP
ncbi:MAG: hypothetical protein ACO22S_07760, partial [Burkholderiaceae bacterium]